MAQLINPIMHPMLTHIIQDVQQGVAQSLRPPLWRPHALGKHVQPLRSCHVVFMHVCLLTLLLLPLLLLLLLLLYISLLPSLL